ncbi:MAG: hypothetical protein ABJP02_13425 [Parasphingorhabdus sp.]|uniref:hypothetical protein n=1 Tax=Parasphingorhabdus sp. TaxID=2709688 RepID=UPI003298E119
MELIFALALLFILSIFTASLVQRLFPLLSDRSRWLISGVLNMAMIVTVIAAIIAFRETSFHADMQSSLLIGFGLVLAPVGFILGAFMSKKMQKRGK